MMTYNADLFNLMETLKTSEHGRRSAAVMNFAKAWNVSIGKAWRDLKSAGYETGRIPRPEKGQSKKVMDHQVATVANFCLQSMRQTGTQILCMKDAIENAKACGILPDDVSDSTVIRMMKTLGVHPKQLKAPKPHQRLRSEHPNHVWQVDASICVLYYMKKKGLAVMDEDEFYKNKPQNVEKVSKQRILRYVLTDHTTGTFYLEYFLTAGENWRTLMTFLLNAMIKRESEPFHGIPKILMWDKGSANSSYVVKTFLEEELGIKTIAHSKGNSRAKGQVEQCQNLVETKFESRLYRLNIGDIETLNNYAHQWMRHYNATKKHTRHGHTRYGLWTTIRKEQLLVCPPRDICLLAIEEKPETATVTGNLTIQYRKQTYSVRHIVNQVETPIRVGGKVGVIVKPLKYPNVYVVVTTRSGGKLAFECEPMELNEYGFNPNVAVIGDEYKALPDTQTDTYRKEMLKQAYGGVETQAEADELRKKRVPAFPEYDAMADVQTDLPEFMERKGIQKELEAEQIEKVALNDIQIRKKLQPLLNRAPTVQEMDYIHSRYQRVTEDDIAGIIEVLLNQKKVVSL